MKNIYIGILILTCMGCPYSIEAPLYGWELVYRNDASGGRIMGDKEDLIHAVRNGYSIRIGWGGRQVEHVADAQFMTIIKGEQGNEVFAQITPIIGQAPVIQTDSIWLNFRENFHWSIIVGTNGHSDRLTVDYLQDTIAGHRPRPSEISWFVEYPANREAEKAQSLSPNF